VPLVLLAQPVLLALLVPLTRLVTLTLLVALTLPATLAVCRRSSLTRVSLVLVVLLVLVLVLVLLVPVLLVPVLLVLVLLVPVLLVLVLVLLAQLWLVLGLLMLVLVRKALRWPTGATGLPELARREMPTLRARWSPCPRPPLRTMRRLPRTVRALVMPLDPGASRDSMALRTPDLRALRLRVLLLELIHPS